MVIKNFEQLDRSVLRRHLLKIAEAGYESLNTRHAVLSQVKISGGDFKVGPKTFKLKDFNRVFVLAFGKAALDSASALSEILGTRVNAGVIIDLAAEGSGFKHPWKYFQATHPLVSEQNVKAVKYALSVLSDLQKDDLVICSISGGGSAIFEWPLEMSVEDESKLFKAMSKGGANISELNTVRKHISRVKGGQLAKHLYPATVVSLLFSDVPGNDLSVIASGPTVKDTTSIHEAKSLVKKFSVLELSGLNKINLAETPKDDKYFENVHNILLISPQTPLSAMQAKAEALGWQVKIWDKAYQGEARLLGPQIVKAGKKGWCLIGAGESTVKILGQGKGGRNQEMALSALSVVGEKQVFGCFASDGHDNTEAAGAIIDASTNLRASSLQLATYNFLNNNDSFNFFEKTEDLVYTGQTGSNVADFFVLINH